MDRWCICRRRRYRRQERRRLFIPGLCSSFGAAGKAEFGFFGKLNATVKEG